MVSLRSRLGKSEICVPGVDGIVTEDLLEKIRLIKWESLGSDYSWRRV